MLNIFLGSLPPSIFKWLIVQRFSMICASTMQSKRGLRCIVTQTISKDVKVSPHNNLAKCKWEWRFKFFFDFFFFGLEPFFWHLPFLKQIQQIISLLLALLGVQHLKVPGWTSALSILTWSLNIMALQANCVHLWGRKWFLYLSCYCDFF